MGVLIRQMDAFVVIHIRDGGIGILLEDVAETLLGRALRHVDDGMLTQMVRHPRDTAAVVAVRRCDKRHVTDLLAGLVARELRKRGLPDILAELPGQIVSDRVSAAEHLEGVEPEAEGFILDEHVPDTQRLCKPVKFAKRRKFISRKSGRELLRLFCLFEGCDAHVRGLVAAAGAKDILKFFFHV